MRWTIKSTQRLAQALRKQGYAVSATLVRRMLVAISYSLQANRKTREGVQHPDRDGQFRHIAQRVNARKRRGEPAISVDAKKKEVLGNLKNVGKTYWPAADPQWVKTHDFPDPEFGQGRARRCVRHPGQSGRRVSGDQPRHRRVRGGSDSPLVEGTGMPAVCSSPAVVGSFTRGKAFHPTPCALDVASISTRRSAPSGPRNRPHLARSMHACLFARTMHLSHLCTRIQP